MNFFEPQSSRRSTENFFLFSVFLGVLSGEFFLNHIGTLGNIGIHEFTFQHIAASLQSRFSTLQQTFPLFKAYMVYFSEPFNCQKTQKNKL